MTAVGPFVCNMNALSGEQRALHGELKKQLQAVLVFTQELPDGYKFQFRPGPQTYEALTRITPLEHACCPFLSISIRLDPAGELFWQLSGNEGVKQFIRMEFRDFFKSERS